ncbi:hypothetical protein [Streptomyces sp. NPDC051219]|uniref:hypothetical protein n=1 Tax=Streptomyces sp. NPDC051219 TaxID=3155283 RepID=UPI003434C9C4
MVDTAVGEAAVGEFLREHPQAGPAGGDHPALLGCTDADWPQIPGCLGRRHPEREQCRAAFAEHASVLLTLLDDDCLPDGLIGADDRECLLNAVAPHRESGG